MSRDSKKNKKSTSKYRKFKVSPLIPVIAVVEVLVLIAISTYAWFVVSQEKEVNTGIISVDADSGLNIDFKNANYDDEINLWDYVPEDFEFSPVTSLDGRNVFVPTSGTFGNDTTNSIVYRDATINDINTKYVDVDFTLTNTNDQDVNVYLNNNSYFRVYDNAQATNGETQDNSRALRLAFYTNDAKHGNVSSSILANTNNENAALEALSHSVTVYFNKPSGWSSCNAYVWKKVDGTNYVAVSWPGSAMTHVAGTVYSYTFSNTEGYDKIIFNNGSTGSGNQTADLTISNGHLYESSAAADSTGTEYSTKTVYFHKPSSWTGVRAHAFRQPNETNSPSFTSYPGDECTNCGADIYSYTFPTSYDGNNMGGIVFNNLANQNQQTADLNAANNTLYYWNGSTSTSGSKTYYSCAAGISYEENVVYFNNTLNWTKPYLKLTARNGQVTRVAMTNLSAGVYYATVPNAYTQVAFEERQGMSDNSAAQTTIYKYTQSVTVQSGYIYRPDSWSNSGYLLTSFSYTDTVGGSDTYAVISPGVSAGFQRAYTPVVGVADTNGAPLQVVPAFASSLDNYIKRSGKQMFTIPANGMLDLSMVIWLEGTDKDCTNANYAAKYIDLYLEFSTTLTTREGDDDVSYYTYRFYDKTRECWTSDRLTNEAGVSVAPVIQLYDNTDKRGYLMHAASTTNIGNTRKVDMWECSAPAKLYTDWHDLYFRRVDPYNEDEVWNYWHPVSPQDCNGAALQQYTESGTTSYYVNFTAFADGAPASTAESGISGNDSALFNHTPERSCGGLWGKHETKLLSVVDGTDGHWFNNNKAVMTLNYTYSYGNSKTQTIEYKASGPYFGQVYYLVVPTDASSAGSGFKIKRYYNFNTDYAMNIKNRNASMTYDSDNVFTFTGSFGYYAYFTKDGSTKRAWFGDAINYINISYKDEGNNKDMFSGARYKVAFYNSGGSATEVRLYTNNGTFQLSNFNGYLTVAPKGLSKMQLRHCSTDWNTIYNYSADLNVSNRNCVAYYWNGDQVGCDSNNNQGTYNWPAVPAVWYPD